MIRHPLQGSCRLTRKEVAHRLPSSDDMRKRNQIFATVLLLASLVSPLSISSQSRPTMTRTELSRMDVLSRASLFENVIADAARREGVDPLILWTIAHNETRFRPWLTSPKNAQGLMQFIPATASRFGLAEPYDPSASIHAAARYVKYLGRLFDWRLDSVLAAYNAGEGTVLAYMYGRRIRSQGKLINPSGRRTHGGIPPYRETVNYVSQGMKIYRWLGTRGKFAGFARTAVIDRSTVATVNPFRPKESKEENSSSNASANFTQVLYDPRTGNRFLISSNEERNGLRLMDKAGLIVITPETRVPATQAARSSYFGNPPKATTPNPVHFR